MKNYDEKPCKYGDMAEWACDLTGGDCVVVTDDCRVYPKNKDVVDYLRECPCYNLPKKIAIQIIREHQKRRASKLEEKIRKQEKRRM